MNPQEITPKQLEALNLDQCFLVDVREPVEHAEERVDGAQLIPLGQLKSRAGEIDGERQIVVMCRSGKRGAQAQAALHELGHKEVKNLTGGILAWKEAGLPVSKADRGGLPLMQQVQVVIGVGVLTGVILSKLVNPNFIYLSAFFGAGLLFAGLSGWCGLAILMSKMPWNRVSDCPSGTCSSSVEVSS